MEKQGTLLSGLMEVLSVSLSYNFQFGVPLKFLVDRFTGIRFEPSGWSGNGDIPYSKSIIDYIFRWLEMKFLHEAETPDQSDEPGTPADALDPTPWCIACRVPMASIENGAGWICSCLASC
jgi:ribonucleoside-diphosphate reductase alpha chain